MPNRFLNRTRLLAATAVVAAGLAVASCMTPTPYQPAIGNGYSRVGYSDEQLEDNRFRVSFAGNSLTARETVERYLLYRSAQLTLEHGYDYFTLADRDTEKKSRTYIDQPFGPGPWGYWGPHWNYYRPGWGWRGWDPYWGDPFWGNTIDVRTVDKYEAVAEIVLGKGAKPEDVHAFDARSVLTNLGPNILLPQPASH